MPAKSITLSIADALDLAELLHELKAFDPLDDYYVRLAKIVDDALQRAANPPPVQHLRIVPRAAQGAN